MLRIASRMALAAVISLFARGAWAFEPPGQAPAAPPTGTVSWRQVQDEMAAAICVLTQTVDGEEYASVVVGSRQGCEAGEASTLLGRAVDCALADAGPLVLLRPAGLDEAEKPGLERQERTRLARSVLLSSPEFQRVVLGRLRGPLAVEGLTCTDCPSLPPLPQRRVTWEQIRPYVVAHFWADTVRPDPSSPLGRRYSYHVCSGLNGVGLIENPDPSLVRAAFLSVMWARETRESAGRHFNDILAEEGFAKLSDDESRTSYLRRRLPEEMGRDPAVRKAVCEKLALLADDLGLVVIDCGATAHERVAG